MNRSPALMAGLAALGVAVAAASLYTVDAREVAVVLSFGKPVRTVMSPGLYFRLPWPLREVVRLDRRARVLAVAPSELLTKDKKNLVVEAFAIWQVSDPQRFLEAFRRPGGNEIAWQELVEVAEVRLSDLVTSRIAAALGQKEFGELLTVEASTEGMLPADVAKDVAETAGTRFGIHVQDVRLRHLGLPLQNEQSIYERMRAERLRIANAYRSEGEEKATTLRAQADREASEILAEADEAAARVLAEAESTASRLYLDTYRQDPAFFQFLRSIDAMEAILGRPSGADGKTIGTERSMLVLDSESDIFEPLTRRPR